MSALFWTTIGRMLARERTPVRRRQTPWRTLARIVLVLAIAALAYGGYAASRNSAFRVREVEVRGLERLTREEVVRTSGLLGASILRLPSAEAEARLERLPYVARASAHGGWSSPVRLEIEERAPRLVLRRGGKSYLVDDSGVVLEQVSRPPRLPLLVLATKAGGDLRPGDRLESGQSAFALAVYGELPQTLRPEVERLTYREGAGYALSSSAGWTAALGDGTQPGVKVEVLRRVLSRKGVSFVDVAVPSAPYYRRGSG